MIDNITADNLHLGCHAKNKAEVLAMIGNANSDNKCNALS